MADKILVLASGGLDSSVVVALYKNLGYDVNILYIEYRNKNKGSEVDSLLSLARDLEIPQTNLYRSSTAMPWSQSACIEGNPSNSNQYVEARNLVFLSLALSCAESLGISKVAIGVLQPYGDYIDTYTDFYTHFNNLAFMMGISVETPLNQMDKPDVVKLAIKLGVSLETIYTCNLGETPCGECPDCVLLKELRV